ncbi:uncharacterized protein H6S33_011194 [Morchella sextelata]|uniref:uncharacterized protein n=1 Tax=Morchella sextelata TaxID=1174677 RepID=UPI001D03F806|nr:uncharacterized protein H6S33_011194 [Morchella sextelata]KAH0610767.1 hypothetical protein H6S33_011194 [Morchella sextelata]
MSLAHLNGENLKLLYAIIKQTDVRALDWDLIAQALEGRVTKNAARKRWGRLRQALDTELSTSMSTSSSASCSGLVKGQKSTPATPKKRKLTAEDLEASA